MRNNDMIDDEVIRKLIDLVPLESPSDLFVEDVMKKIEIIPVETEKKFQITTFLSSVLPYIGVITMILIFVLSSDFPLGQLTPENGYLNKYFLPYINTMVDSFKTLFASKYVTFALGIFLSAGFLVFIDYIFSRNKFTRFSTF